MLTCYYDQLKDLMIGILTKLGAPLTTATKVAEMLLDNELEGYKSHGIIRILQYAKEAQQSILNVKAVPTIHKNDNNIIHIDGNYSFGIEVIDKTIDLIINVASTTAMSCVSITNSHHLGRLSKLGNVLAGSPHNLFLLGFCNYLGGGARVAPPEQDNTARLCTNPMLFAFPSKNNNPFVLDMSTSIVSEGYIAQAKTNKTKIPNGVLIGNNGKSTINADSLYTAPPSSSIAPLGHPLAAHKGYGLAVFVEAIVGMLAGASNITQPQGNGNGLFLIVLNPMYISNIKDPIQLGSDIIHACYKSIHDSKTLRYPGSRKKPRLSKTKNATLTISKELFEEIKDIYISL